MAIKRVYFTRNISGYMDLPVWHTDKAVRDIITRSFKYVGVGKVNKDQVFIHKIHLLKQRAWV